MSYPKNMAESSVLWYSEKRRIVMVEKNELTSYMNVTLLLELFPYAPLFRKQFFLLNKIEILYKFP